MLELIKITPHHHHHPHPHPHSPPLNQNPGKIFRKGEFPLTSQELVPTLVWVSVKLNNTTTIQQALLDLYFMKRLLFLHIYIYIYVYSLHMGVSLVLADSEY